MQVGGSNLSVSFDSMLVGIKLDLLDVTVSGGLHEYREMFTKLEHVKMGSC